MELGRATLEGERDKSISNFLVSIDDTEHNKQIAVMLSIASVFSDCMCMFVGLIAALVSEE